MKSNQFYNVKGMWFMLVYDILCLFFILVSIYSCLLKLRHTNKENVHLAFQACNSTNESSSASYASKTEKYPHVDAIMY